MGNLSRGSSMCLFPGKQEIGEQFYVTARVSKETVYIRGGMRISPVTRIIDHKIKMQKYFIANKECDL